MSDSNSLSAIENSSHIVLDGIRRLQDYVHNLEAEELSNNDELNRLQNELAEAEKEFDTLKASEELKSHNKLKRARDELESLLDDKARKDAVLDDLEDKNRNASRILIDMNRQLALLIKSREKATSLLKEAQYDSERLEVQLSTMTKREQGLMESIAAEDERHQKEVDNLVHTIGLQEQDLSLQCKVKVRLDNKIAAMDELVAQLLGLNEALVSKLSGRPIPRQFTKSSEQDGRRERIRSSHIIAQAATLGGHTGRTTEADVYEVIRQLQFLRIRPSEGEHLIQMHDMYVRISRPFLERSIIVGDALEDPFPNSILGSSEQPLEGLHAPRTIQKGQDTKGNKLTHKVTKVSRKETRIESARKAKRQSKTVVSPPVDDSTVDSVPLPPERDHNEERTLLGKMAKSSVDLSSPKDDSSRNHRVGENYVNISPISRRQGTNQGDPQQNEHASWIQASSPSTVVSPSRKTICHFDDGLSAPNFEVGEHEYSLPQLQEQYRKLLFSERPDTEEAQRKHAEALGTVIQRINALKQ